MGSATAGLVFVVAVVVIAVVCLRYSQARVSPMGWQELPFGTVEPPCHRGPWWAQALLAGKALSSSRPCPHTVPCLFPGRSPGGPSPPSPLPGDPVAAVTTDCGTRHRAVLCAPCPSCEPEGSLNKGSSWTCLRPRLHPAPSRKQRHSSDSEYTEKLQQYSEFVSSPCFLPQPPTFPWSLRGWEIPFSLPGVSFIVLLSRTAPHASTQGLFPEPLPHSC